MCRFLSEGGTDIFVMVKRSLRVAVWWGMAVGELVSCVLQRNRSEKQRLFFAVRVTSFEKHCGKFKEGLCWAEHIFN